MREILFRGKRVDNGDWVYWNQFGKYTKPFFGKYEAHSHVSELDVICETVCQYTGLTDKNGIKIFEGDIVKVDGFKPNEYIVNFIEGGFCLVTNPPEGLPIDINVCYPSIGCIIEVIGNIHEVTP